MTIGKFYKRLGMVKEIATWIGVAFVLGLLIYLVWKLYMLFSSSANAAANAYQKVRTALIQTGAKAATATTIVNPFSSQSDRAVAVTTMLGGEVKPNGLDPSKFYVYDPALDPRPWWKRLFSSIPKEAFRPKTLEEGLIGSSYGGIN